MKKIEYIIYLVIIFLLLLNFYIEENTELESNDVKTYIKVEIKGKVKNPGVYELLSGSRVIDLITKAGGVNSDVNTSNINMSSKLTDEMVVMIENDSKSIFYIENTCVCPTVKSMGCNTYFDSIFSSKVSINTATLNELMKIKGIGETRAKAIIEYREKNGNFNSIEEIKNVKGIGNSIYEKIKPYISL